MSYVSEEIHKRLVVAPFLQLSVVIVTLPEKRSVPLAGIQDHFPCLLYKPAPQSAFRITADRKPLPIEGAHFLLHASYITNPPYNCDLHHSHATPSFISA